MATIEITSNNLNGGWIACCDGVKRVEGLVVLLGCRVMVFIPQKQLDTAGIPVDAPADHETWSDWDRLLRNPHALHSKVSACFPSAQETHVLVLQKQDSPRIGVFPNGRTQT